MGLWLAVYFGLQAVAGIALTFEADIVRWLTPVSATRSAIPSPAQPSELARVLTAIENSYPGLFANRINFPLADGLPYLARLTDGGDGQRWVEVDPVAGTAGPMSTPYYLMELISDFHINLVAGSVGHYLVGVTGLALFGSVITGFILGWPGLRRLTRALKISFRIPVTGWFLLHRSTGLLSAVVILITTFTGSVMVFAPWLKPLVSDGVPAATVSEGRPLPAPALLQRARGEFPGVNVRNVRLRDEHTVYRVVLSGELNGRAAPSHQVWLDPVTGEPQYIMDGADLPPKEAFFAWMYPLHVELSLGRAGQVVSVAGGVALLMLSTSGCLVWLRRRQMRGARRPALQIQQRKG